MTYGEIAERLGDKTAGARGRPGHGREPDADHHAVPSRAGGGRQDRRLLGNGGVVTKLHLLTIEGAQPGGPTLFDRLPLAGAPLADERSRRGETHVKALYMKWGRHSGPRGYHHGNLKEALVRAALELIAEKGPAGFTFADAARWAGVSPAAPYRHFRDRDELLADVARRGFEQFAAALATRLGRRQARTCSPPSTGSARPIWISPSASRPIIRRCSRPAFRSTPIRNCARRASAPSRCCAAPPRSWWR